MKAFGRLGRGEGFSITLFLKHCGDLWSIEKVVSDDQSSLDFFLFNTKLILKE